MNPVIIPVIGIVGGQALTTIFTIGYEGHTSESFMEKLCRNRIDALVDIRELPISRKKGFSKSSLAESLAAHGIRYIHMKRLGSPSKLRHDLYHNGQHEQFFAEFSRYLEGELEALQEVSNLSREVRICLMCVEQMPEACHRHLVADAVRAISRQEVVIQHI